LTGVPSFEKINYAVRPAKATQRHMLVEAFGRLARFAPLSQYQYIGFGSTFFVDFRLLHQRFGIDKLFSVEREADLKSRFELNRPYQSVTMLYGESGAMLRRPEIDWAAAPAIVWLDYDEHLDLPKLGDCERVLRRAIHGSVLLVSFSANAGPIRGRDERFRARLGPWLPSVDDDLTLDDGRVAELGLDVLAAHAETELDTAGGSKLFKQLFRYRYDDGHPMATWGGLILDADRADDAIGCSFEQLPYVVRAGGPTHTIELPNLTPVERALVERYLPSHLGRAKEALRRHGIPEEEANRLAAVYRYAPRFVETFA
jgi:hypothetical protein